MGQEPAVAARALKIAVKSLWYIQLLDFVEVAASKLDNADCRLTIWPARFGPVIAGRTLRTKITRVCSIAQLFERPVF
jgi:hypothetical protein